MPEQLDLAQSALAEHRMVERRDALDGDLCAGRNVDSRPACQYTADRPRLTLRLRTRPRQ